MQQWVRACKSIVSNASRALEELAFARWDQTAEKASRAPMVSRCSMSVRFRMRTFGFIKTRHDNLTR
ncbi:hypothetical protein POVWA2_019250 [Plasmodium ovale wallikeri]|uniref:Uncharacterized protein n=1 Tax=Plasmodium ovale wallikeri TaxID=864142 RepID=A0A1A8YVC8_PLAOA|nr:hypothetical protein POVWA2_019250 [Plasmodium ovale wallikeri]SBT35508.1 hypothetical protein POVWA1_027640 [Plasmodium ovale wallikeri]